MIKIYVSRSDKNHTFFAKRNRLEIQNEKLFSSL